MSNRQERKARKAAGQQARFNKDFAERGAEAVYTPTPLHDYAGLEARVLASEQRGELAANLSAKTLLWPFRYGWRHGGTSTGRIFK